MAAFSDVEIVDCFIAALRGERMDIHTAMPGIVAAYYPATQLADIQPALKQPLFDDTGMRITPGRELPILPKVPVIWPRAGGHMFTMPMVPGDFVWISFAEGGTGEYRLTGQVSEPFDTSRHQISYPVCTPGACPDTVALPDASVQASGTSVWGKSGGIQIQNNGNTINFCTSGSTSAPADAPSLASVVDSNFADIKTSLGTVAATLVATTPATVANIGAALTSLASVLSFAATKSAIIKCT